MPQIKKSQEVLKLAFFHMHNSCLFQHKPRVTDNFLMRGFFPCSLLVLPLVILANRQVIYVRKTRIYKLY